MSEESKDDEIRRRAASLWYERFERKREERGISPGRRRFLQFLLLGTALAVVLFGLNQRGQRLRQVTGDREGPQDWSALLSRDLLLDSATGQLFFPIWEDWRREAEPLVARRLELLKSLDALAREQSDLNQEQDRLLGELLELDSRRLELRRELLDEVRDRLGLWRAARLAILLDAPPG